MLGYILQEQMERAAFKRWNAAVKKFGKLQASVLASPPWYNKGAQEKAFSRISSGVLGSSPFWGTEAEVAFRVAGALVTADKSKWAKPVFDLACAGAKAEWLDGNNPKGEFIDTVRTMAMENPELRPAALKFFGSGQIWHNIRIRELNEMSMKPDTTDAQRREAVEFFVSQVKNPAKGDVLVDNDTYTGINAASVSLQLRGAVCLYPFSLGPVLFSEMAVHVVPHIVTPGLTARSQFGDIPTTIAAQEEFGKRASYAVGSLITVTHHIETYRPNLMSAVERCIAAADAMTMSELSRIVRACKTDEGGQTRLLLDMPAAPVGIDRSGRGVAIAAP